MNEEINEVRIKTYDEWLKYYKNATKEQVIEDLTRDVQYFADAIKDIKDLQQRVEQLANIRKEIKEYIEKNVVCCKNSDMLVELNVDDLLNILNKGSDKE